MSQDQEDLMKEKEREVEEKEEKEEEEEGGEVEYEDVETEQEEDIPEEELAKLKAEHPDQEIETKRKVKVTIKRVKQVDQAELQRRQQLQLELEEQEKQKNMDKRLVDYLQERIEDGLDWFVQEYWTSEVQTSLLTYCKDEEQREQYLWVEKQKLALDNKVPNLQHLGQFECDFMYLIKPDAVQMEEMQEKLIVGVIKPQYMKGLLSQMNNNFIPSFMKENTWPENVKKEFLGQLHKFMSYLTENAYQNEGYTELYIPNEDLEDTEAAKQDKELTHRLEQTLNHWYNQIKEVVYNQDSQQDNENAGPLDEIAYWRNRKNNLQHIYEQLEKPELKKIIKILLLLEGSFINIFMEQTEKIKSDSIEAKDNLIFLTSLSEPCKQLQEANPRDIPKILPDLLNRVRMIWEQSKYYCSENRIQGLLQQISNEIIKRCKSQINIKDMFDGDVEKCISDLQDSIKCGKQWRQIYNRTVNIIQKKNSERKWDFSVNSIFAQLDAFVQRCKELKEICEGQIQFARKGSENMMPELGGSRGQEFVNILDEIKITFRKNLDKLRGSDQDKILDVKASKWLDQFNSFKIGIKDLDVMFKNVIIGCFNKMSTIQQGVQLLEAFDYLAKRETIKAEVKKQALLVLRKFDEELDQIKNEYDNMNKNNIQISLTHGKYSGQALYVKSLMCRLEKQKSWIEKLTFFEHSDKQKNLKRCDSCYQIFRQFIVNVKLKEWKDENKEYEESPIGKRLDQHILVRVEQSSSNNRVSLLSSKQGHLESNFDKGILKLIKETVVWKKLSSEGAGPPNYADELVVSHKENLRVLREYVMLVVRDYNMIIDSMDDTEKKLFKKHLEEINMVINPGLQKFKWSSKNILEGFVRDCRRNCKELQDILKMYKNNRIKIQEKCQEIQQKILIKIDKKNVYEILSFEEQQEKHRKEVQAKLKQYLEDIRKILSQTYEAFMFKGPDIQKVWFKYVVQKIDMEIEESLKKSVKMSLLDLLRVVGDDEEGKENITAIPIFKLSVELEAGILGFRPNSDYLLNMMRQTTTAMVELLSEFKRMEQLMMEERKRKLEEVMSMHDKEQVVATKPNRGGKKENKIDIVSFQQFDEEYEKNKKLASFYERISDDHDVDKYTDKILANLKLTCQSLGELLSNFKKREYYYSTPYTPEKIIQNIIQKDDQASQLKSQIEKFTQMSHEINAQKTNEKKGCIVLDNTNIKTALVNVMLCWENTYLKVIEDKCCSVLSDLYSKINMNKAQLLPDPTDHQQLKKNQDLLEKCMKEKPETEARLGPLEDKFNLLDYYGVSINDEYLLKRRNLRDVWTDFCTVLDEIEVRNQKVTKEMYNETVRELDDFFKETSEFKNKFMLQAPYSSNNITTEKAFQQLLDYKENVKDFRKQEEKMRFGLQLFNIGYDKSADLEYIESEIGHLETVWKQLEEWEKNYESFQNILFSEVNLDDLEDAVDFILRKVKAYKNEIKKWDVVINFRTNLEQFKNSIPLIQSLKEPFMRVRHWKALQKNFGVEINPYDADNQLELKNIFDLNILQHAEAIRENCDVAKEEFKIESSLDKIENKWEVFNIELEPYKKGFKLKKAEDIFSVLEDHMGILSAQKTTVFYENFKGQIENWENTLQQIMETLDTLQAVQRQWLYLESIFASQQNDSGKQMIGDRNKFQAVTNRLNYHMNRINDDKNVRKALTYDLFLNDLNDMTQKLDESQKILLQLLERKRSEFPRFYFVANDDLFELLGNSKDSEKVNKHIKKCFEGVKKLNIQKLNQGGTRKNIEQWHVTHLLSDDGEEVLLNQHVLCEGGIENWMKAVERQMRESLKLLLVDTLKGMQKGKSVKWCHSWIQQNIGQLLITAGQIVWTNDCVGVLNNISNNDKQDKNKQWKPVRDDKNRFIEELTNFVRLNNQNVLYKNRAFALITIEVRNRDIIEQLQKSCTSINNFEWQKQLKFVQKTQGEGDCNILQTNTCNSYGFEYQGNNGRLVVTSLTDRCYLTLTTAMHLKKGGSPQGPAGTGKTETVKDLGKAMARYVFVYNCSEGLDHKSLAKMFSGLIQSGSWGCFDEFNRISLEVLSVVAQQIHSILDALREYDEREKETMSFAFEGTVISINPHCAIFITMNPGYAGRQELPDNLKSLFRPVSMMVPQFEAICEITLYASGFSACNMLAVKIVTLYNLMKQQLSKQDHYDFELRAMMSVLINAGNIKASKAPAVHSKDKEANELEELNETQVLMQSIKNMNLPKFISEDIPLFNSLMTDLFPNIDMPDDDDTDFIKAVEKEIKEMGLQYHPSLIQKVIQLYDTKKTRHGNMLVGSTLSGKSTVWQLLARTLKRLKQEKGEDKFKSVSYEVLNPMSVSINELFGYIDPNTAEWNEGVLSSLMAKICKSELNEERWMVIDGPVSTYWIESMNTVLDDNKMLTLLNGDRISLPKEVSVLVEVDDLSSASAATISRCGMVYIDATELGWVPYAVSWIETKRCPDVKEYLADLFEKWMARIINVKNNQCNELIKVNEFAQVQSFCKMMDAFLQPGSMIDLNIEQGKPKHENYFPLLDKWFCFTLVWTIGASVNEDGRNLFDFGMREIEQSFPSQGTVYDYFINNEKNEWELWDLKLGSGVWKPQDNIQYHKMFVPTTDTTRNRMILMTCMKQKIPVLAIGTTGTGKTSLLNGLLQELDEGTYIYQQLVFSANTTSFKVQEIIESKLIKRASNKMIPDGKKSVIFIDDLNMPKKQQGTQPALELIRQWFDYNGWYDRVQRKLFKKIMDVQFVAAMGPPSGGRAQISKRLQSKFQVLNFTFPTDTQAKRIFQSILAYKFQDFEEEIKPLAEPVALATLNLFKNVVEGFRSTPSTTHYVFNLRDMSKVIQGVFQIDRFYCDTKLNILRVWVHEALRVFQDRLINEEDRTKVKAMITEQLELTLGSNIRECTNDEAQDTIFVDFFDEGASNVYQEVSYNQRTELKKTCDDHLEKYNEDMKAKLNIVLFKDAIYYLCKVYRIIKLSRGHGLLVGEGGSGRHSLTRLAAYIAQYSLWQISITKNYRLVEFREDIKRWAEEAGIKGKPGVFLFSDNEVVQDSFLEDVNNILTVGEIPNLFSKDDYVSIRDRIKKFYLQDQQIKCEKENKVFDPQMKVSDDKLQEFFTSRMQNNFHVMLCMSKTGDNLRNYSRMYPGLVNNTTIVWFLSWPREALIEVANKYLKETTIEQEVQTRIATFFGDTHQSVLESSQRMMDELKRRYFVTPTNYVEFVKGYVHLLHSKQVEIGNELNKLTSGLFKLEEASKNSEELAVRLTKSKGELSNKQKECEDLLIKIQNESMIANENQKEIAKRAHQLSIEQEQIAIIKKDADADLQAAVPALLQAEEGLNKLTKAELADIRSYSKPKQEIQNVCSVVMTILNKKDTSWASVKKELSDPSFMKQLKDFDKDNISQNLIKRIQKYTSQPGTNKIHGISVAAGALWEWVLSMEAYGMAFQEIEPKRKKVNNLKEKLKKGEEELAVMYENDAKFTQQIEESNQQLAKIKAEVEGYLSEAQVLQNKMENADKLLTGLASTNEGWITRKEQLAERYKELVGDCLISSAFLSYMGPFPSEYRQHLLDKVFFANVIKQEVLHNPDYQFSDFMAKPTDLLQWQFQGLPSDQFSSDNGVLVLKGSRYALMIDPQQQANSWIKKMENEINKSKLVILDQQTDNFMNKIEHSISNGNAVVLQNVEEELEASLEPVLNKHIKSVGGKQSMYLGEKEILYNPHFRLYLTTKLPNPTYKAEISTKVTLVNFAVKQKGLEEQLVSVVIGKMEINLEKTRTELILKKAQNEIKLKELDDDILRQLQESKIQLVDDIDLIKALGESKVVEDETRQQIDSSVTAMYKIHSARENYRSLAKLGSQLYFIINDFSLLDNMYQFSLENYINLFSNNIQAYLSQHPGLSDQLKDKLKEIEKRHKESVYTYACRGLFEKDKQLLSLQMAVKLSEDIDMQEYDFFLRGELRKSADSQSTGSHPEWINNWDMIVEMQKQLPNFANIEGSFTHNGPEWKRWYASSTPETDNLPLEWESKCDKLRKMILLKVIRPDRVLPAVNQFVCDQIGEHFVGSPQFNMDSIYQDSGKNTSVIFILAPGVDPRKSLEMLAKQYNRQLVNVSLGRGQEEIAKRTILEGSKQGQWLFLANCHLSLNFLRNLEKILEQLDIDKNDVNDNFRLFLSTEPNPKFPITLLQRSVRVTTEPPRGIKKNMERIYYNMPEDKFSDKTEFMANFKKLVFSLAWFHSIIIERRKFKTLGWNVIYDFNDNDLETSESILKIYLDEKSTGPIQWDAIKFLVSEVVYGGRVTDEWDRRLLNVYAADYFNDRVITEKAFKLGDPSPFINYVIPDDANIKDMKLQDKLTGKASPLFYLNKIKEFTNQERPEAFGQHINAEISSQIADTNNLINSIISLEPLMVQNGEEPLEKRVTVQIESLKTLLPEEFDTYEAREKVKPEDQNPLKIMLLQELSRFNTLLVLVRQELDALDRGIKGLDLISEDLEQVMENLLLNRVPANWKFLYHSLKPLNSWMHDLIRRCDQLREWVYKGQPNLFWISGFSFPTGFTTALQQQSARRQSVPIDNFIWEFQFLPQDTTVSQSPKEGAYVTGLFLEGARWDFDKNYLLDAEPMKLFYTMPVIHFKPIIQEAKQKAKKGQAYYNCPTYMYPIRTGVREKPSFMFTVQLPLKPNPLATNNNDVDYWIKKGTALLMSLAN